MDVTRAQEIIESKQIVQVQLQGQPVWIDSVDAGRATATVHTEGKQVEPQTVRVEELNEVH